jgi:GMP synthase-like glutamine amidotransferase
MEHEVRIAIIDMYNGEPNQGMRCIRELLEKASAHSDRRLYYEIFDARGASEIPDLSFDGFISTGGAGSPFDGNGSAWEDLYFRWLNDLWEHNRTASAPKPALFICHSFQLFCRHFGVGKVTRRKSESFGVLPVHPTPAGTSDPLLRDLPDPFFAADFRHWQVTAPDNGRLDELGGRILAIEKDRPYVPYERAMMAVRLPGELVAVQFHPEADAVGMAHHFRQPARKREIVRIHGQAKYTRIMHRLTDPEYLDRTHRAVLPRFIQQVTGGNGAA